MQKKFGLTFKTEDPLPFSDGPAVGIKRLSFSSSGEAMVEIRSKAGDLTHRVMNTLLGIEPIIFFYTRLNGIGMMVFSEADLLRIHIYGESEMVVKFARGSPHFLQCWVELV